MPDALDAWEIATDVLTAACAALDTLPDVDATLTGCPARAYVSPGLPAIDCDQLTVHLPSMFEAGTDLGEGPPELSMAIRTRAQRVNIVTLRVMLARCLPKPSSGARIRWPSLDQLELAAKQHAADGWVLWNGLYRAAKEGQLGRPCDAITFAAALPLDPQGGYGGWSLTVQMQLDGFRPNIGS